MSIQLRNHTYHFRFVVPPAYRAIVGKQEIRQSLKTGNKRIAQHKAIVLAGQVIAELEGISSAPVLPVGSFIERLLSRLPAVISPRNKNQSRASHE